MLKKLLKKFNPDYKTKKELEEEIAFLKGFNFAHGPNVVSVTKGNIQTLVVSYALGNENLHIPTAYIKAELAKELSKKIINLAEFDFQDNGITGKAIISRIHVVVK